MQQLEKPFWVRREFFQWLALDTRNHSTNQPSCQTEFDNCYQRPILIESDERPAEVIFYLRHGHSTCHHSDDGATTSLAP
jgi:hypothetical protein